VDCSRIIISHHALRRFRQRWLKFMPEQHPRGWEGEMRKLLSSSEEIKKKSRALQAAIKRHGRRARYFARKGWIFVLNEQLDAVITVWCKGNHLKRKRRLNRQKRSKW